jgi:formylmethanofuran:tetrahydromethanopterin formyltransferase
MQGKKRDIKAQEKQEKALVAIAAAATDTAPAQNIKAVITSAPGSVLVDSKMPSAYNYKVLIGPSNTPYSCYLMWSDLKDNHNKFYVSQAVQHTTG